MRATELQGLTIRTEDGRKLGRVAELILRDGRVTALICAPTGLVLRFTRSRRGRRIPWSAVRAIKQRELIVAAP